MTDEANISGLQTASSAEQFVLGVGPEAAAALETGVLKVLGECRELGRACGAFLTPPLGVFVLPQGSGSVRLWTGVYELRIDDWTINELMDSGGSPVMISALVGAVAAVTGGMLAPVGEFLAIYIARELPDLAAMNSGKGVTLRGGYSPPLADIVATPGGL